MHVFTNMTKNMILFSFMIIATLSTIFIINNNTFDRHETCKRQKKLITTLHKTIPFVLVMCVGAKSSRTAGQLQQIRVLLKSAATLTQVDLRFILFSDSKSFYQDVVSSMKLWPNEYQRRLQMNFSLIRYPPNSGRLSTIYRPCATYRLFIPNVLEHTDAAIYIDTDTLFMEPPERMLELFTEFNNEEAGSQAEEIGFEIYKPIHPYPGKFGFNSGVMLMNLTRLRAAPGGGLTNATMNLWQQYNYKADDQVLLNLFFYKNPQLLRELSCEWNYNIFYCMKGRNRCLQAEKYGISLVHGNSESFLLGKDTPQDIFEAWEAYEFGKPIKTLVEDIQKRIANRRSNHGKGLCYTTINISNTFTRKLSLHRNF